MSITLFRANLDFPLEHTCSLFSVPLKVVHTPHKALLAYAQQSARAYTDSLARVQSSCNITLDLQTIGAQKTHKGFIRLVGTICGQAFLQPKSTISHALQVLKHDISRSLVSRISLLTEEYAEDEVPIHSPFLPLSFVVFSTELLRGIFCTQQHNAFALTR